MKNRALLALCALSFAFTQAQADALTAEPTTTAYWEIPLDKTRAGREQASFGLRMDQVVRDNQIASLAPVTQVPMLDFRFNTAGVQGIYVRGINMATPDIMKLGVEEAVLWIAGGVALGATVLIVEANNHGGNTTTTTSNCPAFSLNACLGSASQGMFGVSCC